LFQVHGVFLWFLSKSNVVRTNKSREIGFDPMDWARRRVSRRASGKPPLQERRQVRTRPTQRRYRTAEGCGHLTRSCATADSASNLRATTRTPGIESQTREHPENSNLNLQLSCCRLCLATCPCSMCMEDGLECARTV
jgi:hypothetical protein